MSESPSIPLEKPREPVAPEPAAPAPVPGTTAASNSVETQPVPASAQASTEPAHKGYQMLDPQYVIVERIAGIIFALFVTAGVLVGIGIWLIASWPPTTVYWLSSLGALVALVMLFIAAIVLPAAEHRHARWRVDETGLEIIKGIFWRREITVPRARVQHTDIQQGPLARRYGLAKIVIHTAGTQAASVELSGLAFPIAKWLRDVLINEVKGRHDAV